MINNVLLPDKPMDYRMVAPVGAVNPVTGVEEASSKANKVAGAQECQSCENRKYQDGSNENVSFKAPTNIDPSAAGNAVRAHEGEHVANAYSKAAESGGKVLQASVSIKTAICPECGNSYVAGGETSTMIKYSNEENQYVKEQKAQHEDALKGQNVDEKK
jgi:hypothetical protein